MKRSIAAAPESDAAIQFEADYYEFYRQIGRNIRAERERKKLSNEKLAALVGRSGACVTLWQSGKRAISVYDLSRVAEELEVPLTALLMGEQVSVDDKYRAGRYAGLKEAVAAMRSAVADIEVHNGGDTDVR